MSHSQDPLAPLPPLLLAIVHGIGGSSITQLRTKGGFGEANGETVFRTADRQWRRHLLGPCDVASELRDLGVSVDRSGVLFGRSAASDADAVLGLARRPTGPAQATILELGTPLECCWTTGTPGLPPAIERTAEVLRQASKVLRASEPVEVWLAGLGELQPVERTFDFIREWQRAEPDAATPQLKIHVSAEQVHVSATSLATVRRAGERLSASPFRGMGRLEQVTPFEWSFAAAPGVAFGGRRTLARPALPDESPQVASLPVGVSADDRLDDMRSLFARFWLRAARHARLASFEVESAARAGEPIDLAGLPSPIDLSADRRADSPATSSPGER